MVSLRRHFVPNPVPFSETRFTPPCKLFLVLHTRYDVQNRLVGKTLDPDGAGEEGTSEEYYAYDGDQILLRFDGPTANDLVDRYLWAPAVDLLLSDEKLTGPSTPGDIYWALGDNLNTVRDIAHYNSGTDTTSIVNHRVFDAFGNLTSETNSAVDLIFSFTGRLFDEATGLQNNLNRWYDPTPGRWLSEDPKGFAAGDVNIFRYVGNEPTARTDPTGLAPQPAPDPDPVEVVTVHARGPVIGSIGPISVVWFQDVTGERVKSTKPEYYVSVGPNAISIRFVYREWVRGRWVKVGDPKTTTYYTPTKTPYVWTKHVVTRQDLERYDASRTLTVTFTIAGVRFPGDDKVKAAISKAMQFAMGKIPIVGTPVGILEDCKKAFAEAVPGVKLTTDPTITGWLLSAPAKKTDVSEQTSVYNGGDLIQSPDGTWHDRGPSGGH